MVQIYPHILHVVPHQPPCHASCHLIIIFSIPPSPSTTSSLPRPPNSSLSLPHSSPSLPHIPFQIIFLTCIRKCLQCKSKWIVCISNLMPHLFLLMLNEGSFLPLCSVSSKLSCCDHTVQDSY